MACPAFVTTNGSTLRKKRVSYANNEVIIFKYFYDITKLSPGPGSSSHWNNYIRKLRVVSWTAGLVSQKREPVHVKEIPGVVVSVGTKPISLQMPTILEINIPNSVSGISSNVI